MLWDGLFILVALTLAAAGWTTGIINSWRGPLALVFATFLTQKYYIDFSTWIVQQLRTQPESAVALGYITMWIASEIIIEILLNIIPLNSKNRPMIISRLLGSMLGIFKTVLIFLLPIMALQVPINVPSPPVEKIQINFLLVSGIKDSLVINIFKSASKDLLPGLGKFVVSTDKPSFTPNFVKEEGEEEGLQKEFLNQFGKRKTNSGEDSSESE